MQRAYLSGLEADVLRRSSRTAWAARSAVAVIALAGCAILVLGDGRGIYLLPLGILLSFGAAGANAWVLLIEINR